MTVLKMTDFIQAGEDVTFRYSGGTIGPVVPFTAEEIAEKITSAHSFTERVRVSRGLFSGQWGIQFTWVGPRERVGNIAASITEILDGWRFTSWTFLEAERGRIRETADPLGPGARPANEPLPSLAGVAFFLFIVVAVSAFTFAFGRRAAERITA